MARGIRTGAKNIARVLKLLAFVSDSSCTRCNTGDPRTCRKDSLFGSSLVPLGHDNLSGRIAAYFQYSSVL